MSGHSAVEFLVQAHAQAERVARALPRGPWTWMGHWDPDGNFQALEGPDEVPVLRSRAQTGNSSRMEWHPAFDELLPDPEAVLRRVAAERQILAMWEDPERVRCLPEGVHDGRDPDEVEADVAAAAAVDQVVLLLAEAWGWTEETA